ncbi:brain-specific angiogenesis inhibitor 1-associated protein 2-like protein 2 [Latimeria chalumnae]|uniref:brain-specific angiogenesis inhibitor 1-associated protein 2-like protein 2 n=1 Tax=Latimeria chalumnae TaxID=7897 RepID=UPI00313DD597
MAHTTDQLYRATIKTYKNITEQFNPCLENLVHLGNNYVQALKALMKATEVYFLAIRKIGEHALETVTSQSLGQVLVQISDTQRHLNSDLEGVVQVFNRDLLRAMEKNVNLDQQFVNGSKQRYESEYQQRMMALEKQKNELWRTERKKERNVREMQEMVGSLQSQLQMFLSESYRAVQVEEMRRYRFLAEKHSFLSYNFLQFYSRAKAGLQNRIPSWREQTEMSRNALNSAAGMLSTSQSPGYSSGRLTPVTKSFDKVQSQNGMTGSFFETHMYIPLSPPPPSSPLLFAPGSVEDLRTELRRSSSSIPQAMDEERRELDSGTRRRAPSVDTVDTMKVVKNVLGSILQIEPESSEIPEVERAHRSLKPKPNKTDQPQQIIFKLLRSGDKDKVLRAAKEKGELQFLCFYNELLSSLTGSVSDTISRSSSLGNLAGCPSVQAMISHSAGSNRTLLSFKKGNVITVLVPEARNGWLYGKLEETEMQGWFPAAYVRRLGGETYYQDISPRVHPLRNTQSTGNLLDSEDAVPPVDYTHSSRRPQEHTPSRPESRGLAMPTSQSRRSSVASTAPSSATSESRKSYGSENPPELFPRGTNPFATVKLRPTVTNDRSAPIIR